MTIELTELVLTCKSWQEAQDLADTLLSLRLAKSIELFANNDSQRAQVTLILSAKAQDFNKIKKAATINRRSLEKV